MFRKDKFIIDSKALGKLNAINIRHDNSWFGSGWYLDKVFFYFKSNEHIEQIEMGF